MTEITIPQIAVPIHGDVSGVYVIRNNISGRVYVGSSAKIKTRWNGHRHLLRKGTHHAITLQRSWDKHGESAFSFEILEIVPNKADQFIREQHWIDTLQAASPKIGLNGHPRAGGPRGHKMSMEVRTKMSMDRTGRKMPPRRPEHNAAISASKVGMTRSLESRAKQSASNKGKKRKPFTDSHRIAISKAKTGFKASDTTRAIMSASRKGKPKSPEGAERIREVLTSRNKTMEQRRRTAARNRARAAPGQTDFFSEI